MKILLVGNYLADRQESMIRFAEMMQRELALRGHDVKLIAPRAVLFPNVLRSNGIWKWIGYVNKFVIFPFTLRRAARDVDVVHICDHSNAMYLSWLSGQPHVITVNDVIAIRMALGMEPGTTVRFTGRVFQNLVLRALTKAQYAVCISEFTREQLLELVPKLRDRSSVAHMGPNFPYFRVDEAEISAVRAALGLGQAPYFLHVGSDQPRKNRGQLVRIFSALMDKLPNLPHQLVLVGAPLGPDVLPTIEETRMASRVRALGSIDNIQLRALYSGATALIFPSLLEGFGWPIVEAQACGCAVYVSKRKPMTQVAGDAGIYFDPEDAEAAAAVITGTVQSLAVSRELSIANAERFTSDAMVEEYLRAYEKSRASVEKNCP